MAKWYTFYNDNGEILAEFVENKTNKLNEAEMLAMKKFREENPDAHVVSEESFPEPEYDYEKEFIEGINQFFERFS